MRIRTSLVVGLLALLASIAVASALAASPRGHSGSGSPAVHAARSCGTVRGRGARWRVHAPRGVSCSTARSVLHAFLHGKGRMHGPKNGPAYRQYWTLRGWRCGNGAGSVGCVRHKRSIYAVAVF